jgi:hypothetical protein
MLLKLKFPSSFETSCEQDNRKRLWQCQSSQFGASLQFDGICFDGSLDLSISDLIAYGNPIDNVSETHFQGTRWIGHFLEYELNSRSLPFCVEQLEKN